MSRLVFLPEEESMRDQDSAGCRQVKAKRTTLCQGTKLHNAASKTAASSIGRRDHADHGAVASDDGGP